MTGAEEKQFVEGLVANYLTANDNLQVRLIKDLILRTFAPFVRRGRGLELGCEIGYMSERLAKLVDHLDIVDGSPTFLDQVRKLGIPNAGYHCGLIEEFEPRERYDSVFASHILEHFVDVPRVLEMIGRALKPEGHLLVAVPNARAASRQLARHMGIIKDLYELTPNDHRGGHRRVYDGVLLARELESAGFEIVVQGGVMFKPFADFQMDKLIEVGVVGPEQVDGLFRLGRDYPDLCADVYAIARYRGRA
jgi:2-polyprenyl-3-methyl-5-hydroxy-6-metoxy-1,4-benzoquinol methylase